MIERAVAEWAASFRLADAPAGVCERVELIALDAVASGVAGLNQPLVRDVEPVARAFAGDGLARTTFLAAYAITSATACDVYRPGLCHVTPVTMPPLLALSGDGDDDLLDALAVGLELTTRLCLALNYPELRGRGWHAPGVAGPVGAAAAAARLMRLDVPGMQSAMAHGAAQAAGTFAALGTEAVKFNQARGAVSGLLAALVARAGLAASDTWLTAADGGMVNTYTRDARPERLTEGLGDDWELLRISLRRWPAASSVQSLIDLCLELDVDAPDIAHGRIELAPAAYQVSGDRPWRTPLEAQQSARWVAASVLTDRSWWLEHSDPGGRLGAPEIDGLAHRFDVVPDDALGAAAVRVEIVRTNGEIVRGARDAAPGDPELPLDRSQVEAKLRHAAASVGVGADELLSASYQQIGQILSSVRAKA